MSVHIHYIPHLGEVSADVSYKNRLQEYLQKQGLPLPSYETVKAPDGLFQSILKFSMVDGRQGVSHSYTGCSTKKAAEQSAAQQACIQLGLH